jgi:hypothetical protein
MGDLSNQETMKTWALMMAIKRLLSYITGINGLTRKLSGYYKFDKI